MTEHAPQPDDQYAQQARELLGVMPVEKIGTYALGLHRAGSYTRDEMVGVTRAAYAYNAAPYGPLDDRKDGNDETPVQPVAVDSVAEVEPWSPSRFAADGEREPDFREVQFKD